MVVRSGLLAGVLLGLTFAAPAADFEKYLLNDTDAIVAVHVKQLVRLRLPRPQSGHAPVTALREEHRLRLGLQRGSPTRQRGGARPLEKRLPTPGMWVALIFCIPA